MKSIVTKHGILLRKTKNSFENEGVFNPAVIQEGPVVHMFYRAVREGNFSTLGYCKLDGPLTVTERSEIPVFSPQESYEFKGTEDPRIVKISDTYYLTYSAFDGINVFGAYATSKNLKQFKRQGIITPKFTFEEYSELIKHNFEKISNKHLLFYDLFVRYRLAEMMKGKIYVWDKNLMFFPRKINGKFAVLHRLFPSIQLVTFNDSKELTPEFWKEYITNLRQHIVLLPRYHYECSHIGGGCPPIETDSGWLLIYHAAEMTPTGLIYQASAALLDKNDPTKLLARLKEPLFSPTEPWEKKGVVDNVVFPTGTALFDDDLYIYYGAADQYVAVASVSLQKLLEQLSY
ncbi:pesticidal protein Cry7Aa [Aquimarina sp. 2-A2]|uniref:glycoside hydrolase family 130 protein n=1 Tax=Aquimarina sp. 2-A2 TaxID=3382644 RepID=UPI00387F1D13